MKENPNIFVVDDDLAARSALASLLREHNFQVKDFASAELFLQYYKKEEPGCIILDIKMPGLNGMELQKQLIKLGCHTPIIFVTGHGTISWSVQAMKNGAVDFLEKPYKDEALLNSINEALQQDEHNRVINAKCHDITQRFTLLTNREKQVVEHLVYGVDESTNKHIAKKMNISHRTVEEYRAEAMKKMQANSSKELITMTIICDLFG